MKYDFSTLTGEVITRESFKYEEARICWNRAINKYPLAIIFCENEKDVINSIEWARKNSLPIRIRSGRHHYEGYSTGNDVIVIDVSRMNKIDLYEDKMIVKIQGGARNRELYEALNSKGYPFPGGGCPTVGVAGFTLGGGWGYSSRLFGLGCDRLLELEMIDFKGNKVVANNNLNRDLFWACRGAGSGNFGVVTSMTFKVPNKIEMATLINLDCQHLSEETIINIADIYQYEFENLDRRANFKLAIYNSQERGLGAKITGVFYGDKEEAHKIITRFINASSNVKLELDYLTVLEVNRRIQDSHPDYEKYKSGGRVVINKLTKENFSMILDIIKSKLDGSTYSAITLYGLGGAVSDISSDSTAFCYRNAKFILGFQSVWEDDSQAAYNSIWVRENYKKLESITQGAFVNFPIDCNENYTSAYFGDNVISIEKVKNKYDAENIFNFEQGVKKKS